MINSLGIPLDVAAFIVFVFILGVLVGKYYQNKETPPKEPKKYNPPTLQRRQK